MTEMSKTDDSNDKFKHMLSPNAGDQWIQFGWLSRKTAHDYRGKVWLTPVTRTILFSIHLINSMMCLIGGFDNEDSIKYNYDVWALLGSKAIWFYVHVLKWLISSFMIFVPLLFRKYDESMLFIFQCLKGHLPLSALNLTDQKLLKLFLTVSKIVFKYYTFAMMLTAAPINYTAYKYFCKYCINTDYSFNIDYEAILVFMIGAPLFYIITTSGYSIVAIPLTNFLIVVLYSILVVECLIIRLKKVISEFLDSCTVYGM